MKTRLLAALFLCYLAFLWHGYGLGALLPLRAKELGASPALAGYFKASTQLFLALGILIAGRISDRLQRRKEALLACLGLEIILLLAASQVTTLWPFMVLVVASWLVGGCGFTLGPIMAGLFAGQEERGRIFGIMSAAIGVAALLGGVTMGPVADRWGFPTLFVVMALWYACFVPVALFFVDDKVVARAPKKQATGTAPTFGSRFYMLVAAATAGTMAVEMGRFGCSLAMGDSGFSKTEVSLTTAALGLATLLLVPRLGRLSDRFGRQRLMTLGFLLGCGGLLLYSVASELWQFMAAAVLVGLIIMTGNSAGRAFVSDLVAPEDLGRGLARYGAIGSIGSTCGSALMGNAMGSLGAHGAFLLAVLLPLAAIPMVLRIRPAPPEAVAVAAAAAATKGG